MKVLQVRGTPPSRQESVAARAEEPTPLGVQHWLLLLALRLRQSAGGDRFGLRRRLGITQEGRGLLGHVGAGNPTAAGFCHFDLPPLRPWRKRTSSSRASPPDTRWPCEQPTGSRVAGNVAWSRHRRAADSASLGLMTEALQYGLKRGHTEGRCHRHAGRPVDGLPGRSLLDVVREKVL